jgi:hypothetical protein
MLLNVRTSRSFSVTPNGVINCFLLTIFSGRKFIWKAYNRVKLSIPNISIHTKGLYIGTETCELQLTARETHTVVKINVCFRKVVTRPYILKCDESKRKNISYRYYYVYYASILVDIVKLP